VPSLSEQDKLLIRRISEEIYARGEDWFGGHAKIKKTSPRITRLKNSFFLRYELSGNGIKLGTILVKIPREPGMEYLVQAVIPKQELVDRSISEFEMLEEVFNVVMKLKILALTAIRPLFYYPQWNAIVMEELPSRSLEDYGNDLATRLGIRPRTRLFEEALYRTGQWLRMYHETLGRWRLEPFQANEVFQSVTQLIDQLDEMVENQIDFGVIHEQFTSILNQLNGFVVPHVKLHGDLFFQNVIVTPDLRVALLDLNSQNWGPIYSDLSTLITELIEQKLKLSSFGFLMRRVELRRLVQIIVDGYSSREMDDQTILSLYCARSILGMWRWYEQRYKFASGKKKILFSFLNPIIRRYLHQEVNYFLSRAQ